MSTFTVRLLLHHLLSFRIYVLAFRAYLHNPGYTAMILSPNKAPFTAQGVQNTDISFGGPPLSPLQWYDFLRIIWEHVQKTHLWTQV